jgi:hypothetical protein
MTMSTFNKGQKELFDRQTRGYAQGPESLYQDPVYQGGRNWLQDIFSSDPESFKKFAAPYMRQFNEQTIPGLAERFSGAGAQSSSAFQNALGQAGASLQENLAGLKTGLQFQSLQPGLQYAQQPFENQNSLLNMNTQRDKPMSFIQQFLMSLAGGFGQAGGMFAGKKLGL